MQKTTINITRISLVAHRPFTEIIDRLTATIGRPDIYNFHTSIMAAKNIGELEQVVQGAVGTSNLMEFARYDAGEVLRKETGDHKQNILRLLVGNPLIMKEMAKTAPDAAAYAPVTILVDERTDGVHISYDLMESLLVPYGSEAALNVARDLDTKIERLLESLL